MAAANPSREAPSLFPRLISRARSQVWISSMRQSSTSDRSDRLAAPLLGSAGSSRYSGGHLQARIFGDASFPAARIVNWWTATES